MDNSFTLKNYFLALSFFLIATSLFAQEKDSDLHEISGKITYLNRPLSHVSILIKNSEQGTETDLRGRYSLKAGAGDILEYSYVGFETTQIIIEDITSILNIEMIIKTSELDEAIIKTTKEESDFKKSNRKFSTPRGTIDPETAGFSVAYISGEKIDLIYPTLTQALEGKVAGVRIEPSTGKLAIRTRTSANFNAPVIWDVDGVIFDDEPPIDLHNIKSIHILKSLASTNRYGSMGAGGVVVVTTNNTYNNNLEKINVSDQYTNKNFYNNDATIISEFEMFETSITEKLKQFDNKTEAYKYYTDSLKNNQHPYSFHLNIAHFFNQHYKDRKGSIQLLNELAESYEKNPEVLKAIAYQFQEMNVKNEAIKLLEKVFLLRPGYVQSYRDLANAYTENDNYKKAWRMYMSYMLQGKDISDKAIGELLYNEMEWLFYNRKNQVGIRENFLPNNKTINDFRNDVRIVFEWNTSEAEFELEFVNPNKQAYVFDHKLASNPSLIKNEKEIGYSSKEFFISELGLGKWLININYLGNKKPEPTFFKVTVYSDWSQAYQTQKTSIFKFKDEREKVQLFVFK